MSAPVPSSKRLAGPAAHGVDRPTSLPDPLLHHVISYLPMPEVVRMSLLLKRWRYLWTSVPFIHLDYKDFVDEDDHWEESMVGFNRMQKFGDQLLLLRDGSLPLEEARIYFEVDRLDGKCCAWIHHAIRHKARLLHVYGPDNIDVEFHNRAMVPSQHLERIRLKMVALIDTSFRLLSFDFPRLEHLELDACRVSAMQKISSRSLKTIHISYCIFDGGHEICAPNLNHLSILHSTLEGVLVTRDLHSLVTVSIRLEEILDNGIFDGLSHVTTLELHAPLPEPTLKKGLQTCPVFSNLTSLVLGEWCMASDFAPLLLLLRRSPKLKDLTFKLKMAPLLSDRFFPCIVRFLSFPGTLS